MLAHWLCYFNSAINPVIYNFMSCTYISRLPYISVINPVIYNFMSCTYISRLPYISVINPVIYNFMSCTYLLQLSYISAINLSTPSYTTSWAVRISYNFPTSVPSTYQPRHIQLHELYVSLTTFLHQCHQPINLVIYNFMSCTYLLQLSYISAINLSTPSYTTSWAVRISYNFPTSVPSTYQPRHIQLHELYVSLTTFLHQCHQPINPVIYNFMSCTYLLQLSYISAINLSTPSYTTSWAVRISYNFPTSVPSTYQPRHIQLHELYVSLTTFLHQCYQPINPVIYNFMSCTYLLQLSYISVINPVIKKKTSWAVRIYLLRFLYNPVIYTFAFCPYLLRFLYNPVICNFMSCTYLLRFPYNPVICNSMSCTYLLQFPHSPCRSQRCMLVSQWCQKRKTKNVLTFRMKYE